MGVKGSAGGGYTDVDTGGIKWEQLRKLLNLDEEYNRPNRQGAFGGWEYDPETKTQKWVTTDPGAQAAQARMSRRLAGEGFEPYKAPESTAAIRDALLKSRMDRMGVQASPGGGQPPGGQPPGGQPPPAPPGGGQVPPPPPPYYQPPVTDPMPPVLPGDEPPVGRPPGNYDPTDPRIDPYSQYTKSIR